MKRISFILAAAVVFAVGSAFASAKTVKKGVLTKTYYHVGAIYTSTAPAEGLTCLPDDFSCRIEFNGNSVPSVTSFAEGATPTGAWTATQLEANRSYQAAP